LKSEFNKNKTRIKQKQSQNLIETKLEFYKIRIYYKQSYTCCCSSKVVSEFFKDGISFPFPLHLVEASLRLYLGFCCCKLFEELGCESFPINEQSKK